MMTNKNVDSLDLENTTKEELAEKIRQLTAHVNQLKNLLAKQTAANCKNEEKKQQRPFDFKKFSKHHVALIVAYFGWNYHGFAVQEDTMKTIESELFDALLKTRLVESRESSNYHRCGRTDKGVSAFCQVISLDVRSKFQQENNDHVTVPVNSRDEEEIRYAYILNKVLPPDIRIIAWASVPSNFSARFDCFRRTYKYYFPKGNLDVKEMLNASSYLIGEHDFRNFCKMDVGNGVTNYVRKILSVDIKPLNEDHCNNEDGYQIYEICIVGQAFLWHQVRCIVAVLFLIGQKKESPYIIKELLDVNQLPCKPQYNMASDLPLVLYQCDFESISWKFDEEALSNLVSSLQEEWTKQAIKSSIIKELLKQIQSMNTGFATEILNQPHCLLPCLQQKSHKPLLQRPRCDSLENRIQHFKKRLKMEDSTANTMKN